MMPDLDISRGEAGALRLHNNYPPVRGAGAIVGIIDMGVDYTHPDFRHADGSSRILYLWDQNAPAPAYGGVPYGRAYTKAELDVALSSSILLHGDSEAHGTHVCGIAAGNGNASLGWYTGIAPDADIIVVAARSQRALVPESVPVFDACTFIVEWAKSLRRPVAINLSLGWNSGGHSGETLLETGLDNLVRQPGVVIVKAAGNEQELRIHAGGNFTPEPLTPGQTIELEMVVEDNNSLDDLIELWYDDEDRISVALKPPGSSPLDFVTPHTDRQFHTPAGNDVHVSFQHDEDAGDTMAEITLTHGEAAFMQPGTWKLLLRADQISKQGGRFDAWIERTVRGPFSREQTRFSAASADNTRTVSIPGNGRRIITVGSYITRSLGGFSLSDGHIASSSSRGPTRYGMQKPEIAAPGEGIVSARSSQSGAPPYLSSWYTIMGGTSMAAPHVTGAAALILSLRPDLTCEQVKQILQQTARRNGLAASAPDSAWGAGKLDVFAAAGKAFTVQFPRISNVSIGGGKVSWQTDLPTTSAVRYHQNRRRLQLGKNPGSQADFARSTNHTMDLSGLDPGTYYCEILAFTEDNLSFTDDNEGSFYELTIAGRMRMES
jgi:subtilisin family serine protease